jgi:hypothetical protein
MFGWFDTKDVDAFAQWVVDDLLERLPPASLGRADRKTSERVHRMSEAISGRVREFASGKKPNLYQRAHLGNRVKWALRETGYPDDFVATFVTELMTLVTVAGRSRS